MPPASRQKLQKLIDEMNQVYPGSTLRRTMQRFGDDWFTDDQIRDMAETAVSEWRSRNHRNIRNRANWAQQESNT